MATLLAKTSFHLKKFWFSSKNIDLMTFPKGNAPSWFTSSRCRSPEDLVYDGITSQMTLSSTSTDDSSSMHFDITDFRCKKCDSGLPCGQQSRCLNVVKQHMLNLLRHFPEEDVRQELSAYYDAHCDYEYHNQRYIRIKAKLERAYLELAYFEKQLKSPHRKILSPRVVEGIETARQKIVAAEKECEQAADEVQARAQTLFDQGRL